MYLHTVWFRFSNIVLTNMITSNYFQYYINYYNSIYLKRNSTFTLTLVTTDSRFYCYRAELVGRTNLSQFHNFMMIIFLKFSVRQQWWNFVKPFQNFSGDNCPLSPILRINLYNDDGCLCVLLGNVKHDSSK